MKIIILVLIFSFLYNLNCQTNLEPLDEEQNAELKEILTEKLGATGADKQDAEVQDGPEDKVVAEALQGDGEKNEKSEISPVSKDEGHDAELKEILTDMDAEVQEDPEEKVDAVEVQDEDRDEIKVAEVQEDPEDKVDAVNVQGDEGGDEIKNSTKVQTCESCVKDKEDSFKIDEADQIPENYNDNKVQKALNLFPGGDVADLFGNNQHYKIPDNYQDFGRRFVLQYPYTEKKSVDEEAEDDLHNAVQQHIENKQDSQDPLPIKAPPEFVLEVAKRSQLLNLARPTNPTDDIIHKDILRSGDYWNDVRIEEIDPKKILRSTQSKNNLESVKVEIKPGSKLYNLISMLKDKSPRLLYVINKDSD